MPGFDGTGPMGMGPMTGGGRGWCAVPVVRGAGAYPPALFGRPGGRGGRGYRWMYYATGLPGWMRCGVPAPAATAEPDQELSVLRAQAGSMRRQLEEIDRRIAELEKPE